MCDANYGQRLAARRTVCCSADLRQRSASSGVQLTSECAKLSASHASLKAFCASLRAAADGPIIPVVESSSNAHSRLAGGEYEYKVHVEYSRESNVQSADVCRDIDSAPLRLRVLKREVRI